LQPSIVLQYLCAVAFLLPYFYFSLWGLPINLSYYNPCF